MVDYTFKSKGKSYKSKNRKENTVDSYVANVTKNINGANWCDDEEDYEYSTDNLDETTDNIIERIQKDTRITVMTVTVRSQWTARRFTVPVIIDTEHRIWKLPLPIPAIPRLRTLH